MIIEKLKGIQAEGKMTDVAMAAKLGLHPMAWNRLKNGRGRMDIETIRKAVRAYPVELAEPALRELYGEDYMETALPVFRAKLAEMEER